MKDFTIATCENKNQPDNLVKLGILVSLLLLLNLPLSTAEENTTFTGASHFATPPPIVDLSPWALDCNDDFQATWVWQSNDQPIGIERPADSDWGFSDRIGTGITDLEDGTFELEYNGAVEIWDAWANGTTLQIPDLANLDRTYACYVEAFHWDDDNWKFNHNGNQCENQYFFDIDNNFAVFDYAFWENGFSPVYHWKNNWEELADGTINQYVADSYFAIDGETYIGNLTDGAGMHQIIDIRYYSGQNYDYDDHYVEVLHNRTEKVIGAMGENSSVISYWPETHLMDLSQVIWTPLSGKSNLSDLGNPPGIDIGDDMEWRISLCEVRNEVYYLETSRDIFGFRWVAYNPDYVQEDIVSEDLEPEDRGAVNWALDCNEQFPFDFIWTLRQIGDMNLGIEPINQSHSSTFDYNWNGIGVTHLANGTYKIDVISSYQSYTTQYWIANSSIAPFVVPTIENMNVTTPCYASDFGNPLGSFWQHSKNGCNNDVLIDLDNPTGLIDLFFDEDRNYWGENQNSYTRNYLWSNGSAWNGDLILDNKIELIITNNTVLRGDQGLDWSTQATVLDIRELNVGSTNLQYITNANDGFIVPLGGANTFGDFAIPPSIELPENFEWRIGLCRAAASVDIYDAPYSIDAFSWIALPNTVDDSVPEPEPEPLPENDSDCLIVDNLLVSETYYVTLDLVNTCDKELHYTEIITTVNNPLVNGLSSHSSPNMAANQINNYSWQVSLDESIPNDTEIILHFEARILNCGGPDSAHSCPDSILEHTFIVAWPESEPEPEIEPELVPELEEEIQEDLANNSELEEIIPEEENSNDSVNNSELEETVPEEENANSESNISSVGENRVGDGITSEENGVSELIYANIQPVMVLSLTSLICVAFIQSEALRYPLSKKFWFAIGFLVSGNKKDSRGDYQRGKIVGILSTQQGMHLSALIRALGMGNHQAAHHLKILESQGTIWHKRVGREVRFFTADIPQGQSIDELPSMNIMLNEESVPYQILLLIYESRGISSPRFSQNKIAKQLGFSKQLISYHSRLLDKWGLIERTRSGFGYNLEITTEGTSHILEESYQMSTELENDDSQLFNSLMNTKPNDQSFD